MLGNLLLAAVLCSFTVKTSLYDLIGDESGIVSEATKASTKNTLVVIAVSDSAAKSQQSAKKFADSLTSIAMGTDPERVGTAPVGLGSLVPEGRVCSEDAELLKTEEGRAKIAKRALRRYIASPMPPLFKPEEDPFCLKERFVMSLGTSTNAIMPVVIGEEIVSDLDRLIDFATEVRRRVEAANAADPSVKLMVTGVPMHTAATAGRCRREIGYLTWFSLIFIAGLSVVVFRSLKWIPLLAASLAVSAAAGALVVFLGFDSVHLMTLVFGTTVMGLVIDYSFHWLLSDAESKTATLRSLLLSWLTTEIGLVPLMISSLPVLRQTAVFLAVALTAALAFVVGCYPRGRLKAVAMILLMGGVFLGCDRVGTDPAAIYLPPAELLEADRLMSDLWGQTPTNATEIAKLYAEHADKQFEALGIARVGTDPASGVGTDPESPKERLEAALSELTAESVKRLGMALAFMFVALAVFLRRRAVKTMLPSLIAIAAVGGFVLLTEGKINLFHLLAMFLLAGMSIDYTIFIHGVEKVKGEGQGQGGRSRLKVKVKGEGQGGRSRLKVKVKGEGQERGFGSGYRSAFCSLLTSMAGFGALYFVSFPVVSAFGAVLGLGLPIAFLAAVGTRGRKSRLEVKVKSGESIRGEDAGVEKAASPVGMEIVWRCYRIFGRRVMRLICAVVAETVWLSSGKVRKASPNRRKLVNFAWSMADKLVVMAEGNELPRVEVDGSADAQEFVAAVEARQGVFVLSSHVGTVEVLAALAKNPPRFHAWMDIGRTSVFNAFYLRHAKKRKTEIHPIAEIGMQTAFAAGEWLDAGECLVMAGDRGDGAFRFARAMGHPVYFVACIAERGGYRAVIRRLPEELSEMKAEYSRHRGKLAAEHPDQVFEWEQGK